MPSPCALPVRRCLCALLPRSHPLLAPPLLPSVRGKVAILVDDMIDTAGTITNAAKALRQEGARQVIACTSHAVFSPPAVERLSSGVFEEVIVTNTIPVAEANQVPALTILR